MRALITAILALLAGVVVFAAVRQTSGERIAAWFADRPAEKQSFITRFDPNKLTRIELTRGDGTGIDLQRADVGWVIAGNGDVKERADAQRLARLVKFSLSSVVVDSIPRDEMDLVAAGLRSDHTRIRLFDKDEKVADYLIGHETPWKLKIKDSEELMPTLYLRHAEDSRRGFVYVVSDPVDLKDALGTDFARLTDHKPLFFRPDGLKEIVIENGADKLTLSRPSMSAPWEITKPLRLRTDADAVKQLISSLTQLEATELRSDFATAGEVSQRITIRSFDVDTPQTLNIFRTASTDSDIATTDARSAAFVLPREAVAALSLTLDDLRYRFITSVNPAAIQGIKIERNDAAPLLLDRPTPRSEWSLIDGLERVPVDLVALANFFEVLSKEPVIGFPSDTAPSTVEENPEAFRAFGLDQPLITASIVGFGDGGVSVRFGKGADEKYYAHRTGSPHIYEVSSDTFFRIPLRTYEWRDKRLWTLSRVDLKALSIQKRGEPALDMTYNFLTESWSAKIGEENVFARLDIPKAGNYLRDLEKITVARWLPGDDVTALRALQSPVFRATIVQENPRTREVETRTLIIAPAAQTGASRFYFGLLTGEDDLFALDLKTVRKLAADLLTQ